MTCQDEQFFFRTFPTAKNKLWSPYFTNNIYQVKVTVWLYCILWFVLSWESAEGRELYTSSWRLHNASYRPEHKPSSTRCTTQRKCTAWDKRLTKHFSFSLLVCRFILRTLYLGSERVTPRQRMLCLWLLLSLVSAYIMCHNRPDMMTKWWDVTSSPTSTITCCLHCRSAHLTACDLVLCIRKAYQLNTHRHS